MKKIRVAICDDKKKIVDVMSSAVQRSFARHDVLAEVETFSAADQLWSEMREKSFDLLFLDIGLPRMDGITFGEKLRRKGDHTAIIFVSAREDQVFDTFKVQPFAFVRKINFLNDLTRAIDSWVAAYADRFHETFVVQNKNGIMNISIDSVIYVEGSGKTQIIHLADKDEPVSVYRSMETLEEELAEKGFIRIHKGILVNYRYIARIGVNEVETVGGESLPLSRRRAATIKAEYLQLLKSGGAFVL